MLSQEFYWFACVIGLAAFIVLCITVGSCVSSFNDRKISEAKFKFGEKELEVNKELALIRGKETDAVK